MFHIALTPRTNPANALSARRETLMGAIAQLLVDLDSAYGPEEWFVSNVLEAMKEAVDNLEDGSKPACGSWSDMGMEDDSFSIDIFCEDDARYVLCDDHELLAPHGALALINGQLVTEWIYDENELAEWKKDNEEHSSLAVAILIPAKRPQAGEEYPRLCPAEICTGADCVSCRGTGLIRNEEVCEHTGMSRDELESICGTGDRKEGWDDATLDASEWTKEQAIAYLDSHVELDDEYDRGHRAAIKHLHDIA